MAGKYSAGAIIAAMPLKSGSSKGADMSKGYEADDDNPGDSDAPVCKISTADLKKLQDGEAIDYTGEDGTTMKIMVDDSKAEEDSESPEEEKAEESEGEEE